MTSPWEQGKHVPGRLDTTLAEPHAKREPTPQRADTPASSPRTRVRKSTSKRVTEK